MTPNDLTPEAQACFDRVRARLLARGEWRSEYAAGLAPCASMAAAYVREARAIRARKDLNPALLKELEMYLELTRQDVREALADFLMIRVPFAVIDAEGVDSEIAELCAPFDPC